MHVSRKFHLKIGIWRSALTMSSDPDVEMRLEKHLPRAVLCKLRQEVLWELYSELWPITSLFVQLQFADKRTVMELSKSLSDSSRMISEIISFTRVKSTKLFCLTKSKTGLRDRPCLGMCYADLLCGLHEAEKTPVNLATRMMMCYPGQVSCDAETYVASCLPSYSYCFKELPKRNMKGVTNPITAYEYIWASPRSIRKVEINLSEHCLEAYKNRGEPHILAFVGVPGSGKSHLLPELAVLGWAAGHRCLESSGIPHYCEELLCYLRCSNMLLFHTGRPDEGGGDNWQSLITKAIGTVSATSSSCTGNDSKRICAIRPDVSLETPILPVTLKGEHLRRARTHTPERFLAEGKWTTAWDEDAAKCSCQCEVITEAVLVPLAHHYTAVSNASQAFYYLLECVAAYLHVSNSTMAPMKLKEAEILRNNLQKQGNPIDLFEEATFFILKGEVCRNMGQVKLAKRMIRQALSLLGMWFPRTSTGAFVKSVWE
ncbi:hypothetical protein ASZ78_014021 [Callipepla squamata]|uniref:Uncharacterized protein n=1 Tax=Callipepla squamata TaxID=9009 RepID=A0A226N530_CALSU|nr:hypothetical protein ASZ78_014021 [Callipepla squamata]